MKYPTEYKLLDITTWTDNLQKKYYYTNDGVIYKISAYNDGTCSDEDIYTPDEISGFNGIKFDFTYTKENETTVETYILLDYLIQVGDKIDKTNKKVVIHDHDIPLATNKTLLNRFINQQKDEFIDKIINGNTISSVVSTLPSYFKVNDKGKYKVDCGVYQGYEITAPTSFNLGLFEYEGDIVKPTVDVTTALTAKAESECLKLAQSIMSVVNKNVTRVTVTVS